VAGFSGRPYYSAPILPHLHLGFESPRILAFQWASRLVAQVALLIPIVRLCRPVARRVSPNPHPSALPCLNLRVAPFLRSSGNASNRLLPDRSGSPSIFRQCRGSAPRVTPVHRPPGCAAGQLSGLPLRVFPNCCPSALPLPAFPGFPEPCTRTAGR